MERFTNGVNKDTVLDFGFKQPGVREGESLFEIIKAYIERNSKTKYGIRDQVVVIYEITTTNDDGCEVKVPLPQRYLASNYRDSHLAKMVYQLLGRPIGKRFDVEDLVGITGVAEIRHNTSAEGDIYANVERIVSVNNLQDTFLSGSF